MVLCLSQSRSKACCERSVDRVLKDSLARHLCKGTSANNLVPGGDIEDKPLYRLRQAWPLSLLNKTQMPLLGGAVPRPLDGMNGDQ